MRWNVRNTIFIFLVLLVAGCAGNEPRSYLLSAQRPLEEVLYDDGTVEVTLMHTGIMSTSAHGNVMSNDNFVKVHNRKKDRVDIYHCNGQTAITPGWVETLVGQSGGIAQGIGYPVGQALRRPDRVNVSSGSGATATGGQGGQGGNGGDANATGGAGGNAQQSQGQGQGVESRDGHHH